MDLDRISNLPDNIIDQILSLLPIREAANTGLLSREWRYKWANSPCLVFDDQSLQLSTENHQINTTLRLVNFIDRALLLHFGPICKFELSCLETLPAKDIDKWIIFHLSRRSIKDFVLEIRNIETYKLPCCVFSWQNMTRLDLANCLLKPPSTFKGFKSLKSLNLQDVTLDQSTFDILVSGCSTLENLNLRDLYGVDHLHINSPNLRSFGFEGRSIDFRIQNASHLTDFFMFIDCLDHPKEHLSNSGNLIKLLADMPRIERLIIIGHSLEWLVYGSKPKAPPVPFVNLRYLSITIDFTSLKQASTFLFLLRSVPNLQELDICSWSENDEASGVVWGADRHWSRPLARLRHVEIGNFCGTKGEIEFIGFVLLAAPALARMSVELDGGSMQWEDGGDTRKLEIVKQLLCFKRASPQAQVTFVEL